MQVQTDVEVLRVHVGAEVMGVEEPTTEVTTVSGVKAKDTVGCRSREEPHSGYAGAARSGGNRAVEAREESHWALGYLTHFLARAEGTFHH